MFKRLSIYTVILSGILLAGCANQQLAETQSAAKSEQTQKSTTKKAPKKSTKSADSSANNNDKDTSESAANSKADSNQETTGSQTAKSQTDNSNSSNSNTTNSNDSQSSQDQQSQTQQSVNLTTSDEAVEYLANQLSSTYDKTTTQYVANGKVTWNNVSGYQINIYSKNSDSPVGSYLMPANGQYFQIW